jgi:hypothetical protein
MVVRESGGGAQGVQRLLIDRNKIFKRDVLEGSSSVFIVSSFMVGPRTAIESVRSSASFAAISTPSSPLPVSPLLPSFYGREAAK